MSILSRCIFLVIVMVETTPSDSTLYVYARTDMEPPVIVSGTVVVEASAAEEKESLVWMREDDDGVGRGVG